MKIKFINFIKKYNYFILSLFILSIICVGAETFVESKQVTLSSDKTSNSNVYDALEDLYTIAEEKIRVNQSDCPEGMICTACTTPGTYANQASKTCSTCAAGTYSLGNAASCTSCPTGYTSAAGATSDGKCYIQTTAGKYIATAKSGTQASCPAGSYCSSATVYYGSTGNKTACPSGYTSATGATVITNCYVSVAAGKYKTTATGSAQASCPAGTYKAAHSSYYNSSDSCTTCPTGYYCPAGSSSATKCASGYTSVAGASSCKAINYTYTKKGSNGWVGTYVCDKGTAKITGCTYSNYNVACNGGYLGMNKDMYMCTLDPGYSGDFYSRCNADYRGYDDDDWINGGGLPETESCS